MPSSEKEKITLQSGPTTTVYTLKAVPETHDGEYSDQEILSLVNYFETSRAELKNVSIIRTDFPCPRMIIKFSSRTMHFSVLIHFWLNQ